MANKVLWIYARAKKLKLLLSFSVFETYSDILRNIIEGLISRNFSLPSSHWTKSSSI